MCAPHLDTQHLEEQETLIPQQKNEIKGCGAPLVAQCLQSGVEGLSFTVHKH